MSSRRERNVFQRLFKKDTVNSLIRRLSDKEMCNDSLDLVLSSVYNHETDLFVSKFNTLLQLDNAKYNPIKERLYGEMIQAQKNNIHHPLVIGKFHIQILLSIIEQECIEKSLVDNSIISAGITEKKSPHSIKLICTGEHTPITNPGYSRQPLDGNIFKY